MWKLASNISSIYPVKKNLQVLKDGWNHQAKRSLRLCNLSKPDYQAHTSGISPREISLPYFP